MTYKLVVPDTTALQMVDWFLGIPPGIRVWHSIDLSRPEQQWITPITEKRKPHWGACNLEETEVITDPREVAWVARDEVERFPVELRVSGNSLSLKLTDASNIQLNERLDARGMYASYEFDYESQEAVILDVVGEPCSLETFLPPKL